MGKWLLPGKFPPTPKGHLRRKSEALVGKPFHQNPLLGGLKSGMCQYGKYSSSDESNGSG
jgi:hypothetical protein